MRHFKLEFTRDDKDVKVFCFSPSCYGEQQKPAMMMFMRCCCEECKAEGSEYQTVNLNADHGVEGLLRSMMGEKSYALNILGVATVGLGTGDIVPMQITEGDQVWLRQKLGESIPHNSFEAIMGMVDEALTDAALSKLVGE